MQSQMHMLSDNSVLCLVTGTIGKPTLSLPTLGDIPNYHSVTLSLWPTRLLTLLIPQMTTTSQLVPSNGSQMPSFSLESLSEVPLSTTMSLNPLSKDLV